MSKKLLSLMFGTALVVFSGLPVIAQQSQPDQRAQPAQQSQGKSQAAKSADDIFAQLDANKDGKLSKSEFSRLSSQEKFEDWDADGDGSVSKAEFTAKYGH